MHGPCLPAETLPGSGDPADSLTKLPTKCLPSREACNLPGTLGDLALGCTCYLLTSCQISRYQANIAKFHTSRASNTDSKLVSAHKLADRGVTKPRGQ